MSIHLISDHKKDEKPPVDAELVRQLEKLLAEVKSGEVTTVVALLEFADLDRPHDYITAGYYDCWRIRGLLGDLAIAITDEDDDED